MLIGSTAANRIRLNDLRLLFVQPIAGNGTVLLYDLCHMVEFLRISGIDFFLLHPGAALLDRTGVERAVRHPVLRLRQAVVAAKSHRDYRTPIDFFHDKYHSRPLDIAAIAADGRPFDPVYFRSVSRWRHHHRDGHQRTDPLADQCTAVFSGHDPVHMVRRSAAPSPGPTVCTQC